jgi:hypothetical protein
VQVASRTRGSPRLPRVAQLPEQLRLELPRELHGPGPARRLHEPRVGLAAAVGDAEAIRDPQLARVRGLHQRLAGGDVLGQLDRDAQHVLVAAAEQRERAVRRDAGVRLGIGEVVAELRARLLLAVGDRRDDDAVLLDVRAQRAHEVGVLGELLHQHLARAVERGLRVRHAGVPAVLGLERRLQVLRGLDLGIERRIREQRVREHVEPGLARDLRLRAALRLVRRVEVLEPLLRLGAAMLASSAGVSLPCSSMLSRIAVRRSSSSRR